MKNEELCTVARRTNAMNAAEVVEATDPFSFSSDFSVFCHTPASARPSHPLPPTVVFGVTVSSVDVHRYTK